MAFAILVEFHSEPDWKQLSERLGQISKGLVEYFPIPAGTVTQQVHCLGIAVPARYRSQPKIWEIKSLVNHLLAVYECEVFELYNGNRVTVETLPALLELIDG